MLQLYVKENKTSLGRSDQGSCILLGARYIVAITLVVINIRFLVSSCLLVTPTWPQRHCCLSLYVPGIASSLLMQFGLTVGIAKIFLTSPINIYQLASMNNSPLNKTIRLSQVLYLFIFQVSKLLTTFSLAQSLRDLIKSRLACLTHKTKDKLISIEEVDLE